MNYKGRRNPEHQKFYTSLAWRKLRQIRLSLNPCCQNCQRQGRVTAATQVHHLQSLQDNWDLKLDLDNTESICDRCHIAETNREARERQTGKKEQPKPFINQDMFDIE